MNNWRIGFTVLGLIFLFALGGCASSDKYASYDEIKDFTRGSADSIAGKSLVVTVAVSDGGDFDGADYELMMENYTEAFDYITRQVSDYGKESAFIFTNGDSTVYPEKADISLEYDGDDIADFAVYDYDELMKAEYGEFEKLKRRFEADSILYAFLIDGSGESFSAYHWSEDESSYYPEGCFMFLSNPEGEINGSSLYVKKILSVYGGFSLENPEPTFGYDKYLCGLTGEKYSFDVMFNTEYEKSADELEITDISAYLLDLSDDFEEIGKYPLFVQPVRRGYTDRFKECYKDGSRY